MYMYVYGFVVFSVFFILGFFFTLLVCVYLHVEKILSLLVVFLCCRNFFKMSILLKHRVEIM